MADRCDLSKEEIMSLKDNLCSGLSPNAEPPVGRDRLLRELIRLESYLDTDDILNRFFSYYKKEKEETGPLATGGSLISIFFFLFFVGIINFFIDSTLIWVFIALFAIVSVFGLAHSKRDNEETLKVLKKDYARLYSNVPNNFLSPIDAFFVSELRLILEKCEFSNYKDLKLVLRGYWDKMDCDRKERIRYEKEFQKQVERKQEAYAAHRLGLQWGGHYGKCSCGSYFGPLGVCPNCGKKA